MRLLGNVALVAVMTCTSALTVERGNAPMDLYRAGNYEAAVAAGEADSEGDAHGPGAATDGSAGQT